MEPLNNSELGLVKSNTIAGNVHGDNNGPQAPGLPTPVAGNTIHGNLERQGNTSVADFGKPDTVDGHKRGQRAGLRLDTAPCAAAPRLGADD